MHGLQVLGWYENYEGDDVPPKRIWGDPKKLDAHFEEVRARQKRETSAGPIDDPVENDYAKDLIHH